MSFHSETYIVDIERNSEDSLEITVHRYDGKWYDEEYTLVATLDNKAEIGEVIRKDWDARSRSEPS